MLVIAGSAKSIRRALDAKINAREALTAHRQDLEREKLKAGLGGQRLGKHKVPEGEVDVQLGEELSESLRELKVRSRAYFG